MQLNLSTLPLISIPIPGTATQFNTPTGGPGGQWGDWFHRKGTGYAWLDGATGRFSKAWGLIPVNQTWGGKSMATRDEDWGCAEGLRNERKGPGRELFPSETRHPGDVLSRKLKWEAEQKPPCKSRGCTVRGILFPAHLGFVVHGNSQLHPLPHPECEHMICFFLLLLFLTANAEPRAHRTGACPFLTHHPFVLENESLLLAYPGPLAYQCDSLPQTHLHASREASYRKGRPCPEEAFCARRGAVTFLGNKGLVVCLAAKPTITAGLENPLHLQIWHFRLKCQSYRKQMSSSSLSAAHWVRSGKPKSWWRWPWKPSGWLLRVVLTIERAGLSCP